MLQKVTLIGNLGNDPELKYTPTGVPVCTISVATNRQWKNQDGTDVKETVWFRCKAWRQTAETINQYLTKGRQVYIEGRLTPDTETGGPRIWTGQDGKPRASFEVTIDNIKFLGGGRGTAEAGGDTAYTQQEPPPPSVHENEIPF
jgi:single-strand DNA-binding protein